MTNAAANLPGGKGILVRRIVAAQQNGLGVIELIHGEQGIGGKFTKGAERGDQAGVVRGAVVINVVGAKGRARQTLEEIVFLVGGAIGADEANGIGAILGVNFF